MLESLIAKETFLVTYKEKFQYLYGKELGEGTNYEKYFALAILIRDQLSGDWINTSKQYVAKGQKQVYYFSIEFLLGRLLGQNLTNLSLYEELNSYLAELDMDLNELEEMEHDAGLGNGGLGRLAACFLDSLACLGFPGHGCGIRYKYGLFQQKFIDGFQMELPDNWLKKGYPWEIRKWDKKVEVRFGGKIEIKAEQERLNFIHSDYSSVFAIPYDIPVVGGNNKIVNTLRLWSAEALQEIENIGPLTRKDYIKLMEENSEIESITQILYPDDNSYDGKTLRLKQQYFLVSAGIQSIIRHFKKNNSSIMDLPEKIAIHINDTHPALAIPELMRILLDEEGLAWGVAWKMTTSVISYTNHTVLPEALEKWNVDLFKKLLPRIYMIIEEINEHFSQELWNRYPGNWAKSHRMAIIADHNINMVHLAVVGSHSVNGVARIHTEILKQQVLKEFHELDPLKINNKTNGVTHRRWLIKANPELAQLITKYIGTSWKTHPTDLINLLKYRDNDILLKEIAKIKLENKKRLAQIIKGKYGVEINPHSIFDIHIKRIHAYKRQLLNVLHIMDLYNRLKLEPQIDIIPRTFIFAGKAAPSYHFAKTIIKLINTLAVKINNDKALNDKVKVIFLENYNVSMGELLFTAADVSEQISTAGKEASGTGNMKFCLNGAVTLGTLDGANIEIREEVGEENFINFGLTAEEVLNYNSTGEYFAWEMYEKNPRLQTVLEQLVDGTFGEGEEFRNIYDALLTFNDEFFVLKDFPAYVAAQGELDRKFRDKQGWLQMSLHNIAHAGKFSSDKTIWEYAIGIWDLK